MAPTDLARNEPGISKCAIGGTTQLAIDVDGRKICTADILTGKHGRKSSMKITGRGGGGDGCLPASKLKTSTPA
jgi:hypothetical protein